MKLFVFLILAVVPSFAQFAANGSWRQSYSSSAIAPSITTSPSFSFTQNQAITPIGISNTGGTHAMCTLSEVLPAGLVFSPLNCTISGTPTAIFSSTSFTVTATNAFGVSSATFTLAVLTPAAPNISTSPTTYTLTQGIVMTAITFTNSGGPITSCSSSPTLPAGLSISNSNCTISGTPTTLQSATGYTISATNSGGTGTFVVTITVVAPAPVCSSSANPSFSAAPINLVAIQQFNYTGADQSFVVPGGLTTIRVTMWGAGGAGGGRGWETMGSKTGGAGGYSQADIAVTPGETLTLVVGQGGIWDSNSYMYGGGGAGANSSSAADGSNSWGGSGGGMSAIKRAATYLLIAGGGGSGGAAAAAGSGGAGGAGGGVTAEAGANISTAVGPGWGGGAGTATAGGASGGGGWSPTAGSAYQGGTGGSSEGPGGGSGYYGGGGGGGIAFHGFAGGGGGAGYSVGVNSNVTLSVGAREVTPNYMGVLYPATCIGTGGAVGGTKPTPSNGGNGYILIQ